MNARSVRFRLTAWYALILALTFAAAGAGVWWSIRESIHDTVDKDLRARLRGMREYLQKESARKETDPLVEELAEQAALALDGTSYRIAGPDGHWIYQSPGAAAWDAKGPDPASLPLNGSVRTIRAAGRTVRVLSAPISLGLAQIGSPLDEFYEMLDRFTWNVLWFTPLLLLLASAGGYWMSRRALQPVDRITRMADEIEARDLARRLPLRGAGDELDRLSLTLNSMFERLEKAFQRMTQFTADASHELRTPVAIIRTTAEVARGKVRTEAEYMKMLDDILKESERTTSLLEDLMLLARADGGSDGLLMEPMDLAGAVGEACSEVRVLAEAGGVDLETCRFSRCCIRGDEQALRRLLLILLDNAIRYTPPGGRVAVCMKISEGPAAIVEVRDTGIGISAEDLPHVFDRFYRAAKDRSRKTGGAGLGLSIARWIVERHGGTIHAESELHAGSKFRVTLPLAGE